jgi:hypothetical protein
MSKFKLVAVVFLMVCASLLFAKEAVNFSGDWVLDRELSKMPDGNIQISKIKITQEGNKIATNRTYSNEYGEEYPFSEDVTLGGDPLEHNIYDMPRKAEAKWSTDKKSIVFESTTTFYGNSGEVDLIAKEKWDLDKKAGTLTIEFTSSSSQGEQKGTAVFKQAVQKTQ